MSKWSFFFLLVPIFGVGIFAVAPFVGWSLPENVSTLGRDIDHLYYVILAITGVAFVATNAFLVYILYRFGQKRSEKALYTHGSHKLEVIWTIVPAAILLFIALYQMNAWIQFRFPGSKPNIEPIARVVARQFEWRIIYPGPDGKLDTVDDVHVANELHVPMNRRILIDLRSMDVLHSFFLPHLRVKQDAVPGLAIPVWFDALKSTWQFQSEGCSLTAVDFTATESISEFAVTLLQDKTPTASFIKSKLTEAGRSLIRQAKDNDLSAADQQALIAELNTVFESETLYDAQRLSGVKLSGSTRELLEDKNMLRFRKLINRHVLADAFPAEIRPLPRHYDLVCAELCGWGHYKMKGRLFVHETQEDFNNWQMARYAEQEASR